MPRPSVDEQIEILKRRCERIVPEADLRKKLDAGRPLRVKLGLDPTAPDITLGNCVPLKVVRQFQDWGHKAVVIVGDYTARVGDPTGVNATRPVLSEEQIDANAKRFHEQIGSVVRTDPDAMEVRYNGEWLRDLSFADLIRLASKRSVSQVLEREDFRKRLDDGTDVRLHELLYPLVQGYDSVMVRADVEMGGADQLLNNLVGRDLQKDAGQEPQVVVVTPLLVGTDGSAKMSKSKGNAISPTDPPGGDGGIFGKIMSLPDEAMAMYYRLLTDVDEEDFGSEISNHPRNAKARLAKLVITEFHPEAAAEAAEKSFMTATHGGIPDDVDSKQVGPGPHGLASLLVEVGFASSTSEAMRLVKGGGVKLDGEKATDPRAEVTVAEPIVLQAGKRKFVRLVP